MKLGTKGRYAVMAVVDLAKHGSDKPISLSEISERQEISLSYLEQLFSKLRKSSIVLSARGAQGGYMLARNASHITIAEIVSAAEEPLRLTRCSKIIGNGCMSSNSRCLTHNLWEELGNHIYEFLDSVTLDDVLNKNTGQSMVNLFAKNPEEYPKKISINE
tara:strand:- start:16089 stop:16571 length:483 start_codon:yes stop_codon:yes gene_type:complete